MELAAEKTAEILKFCDERNQNLVYEIGTEEAIYKITPRELDIFIQKIRTIVPDELFQKIKYLVIQCGTKLLNGRNIGDYDETQLKEMLNVAEKYGKIAKEHNGDWVSEDIKTQKYNAGLRCINVAPEMAEIENCVILEHIKTNDDDYNTVYDLCIKSEKWKKWVDFDDIQEKRDEIILLCCHYVFSSVEFMKIKEKYGNIDNIIQERIAQKLEYFYKNQQITRNSVCFVIANKYVKSINSSYLKFYVDNINKYYPDGFVLIVDNNSENMEDIYNLLNYNTNVKIITNDTEYKFETGAYRCGIQWLMENNLINNYNYFIFTQDTFMLKNIYDFNEKSSLAFSLISFKYDYFKQSVVENILQEIGLNDNYEKINLCVANSFGVHYSKIEQLFNYIKNIKTQTKQDSQIMEHIWVEFYMN